MRPGMLLMASTACCHGEEEAFRTLGRRTYGFFGVFRRSLGYIKLGKENKNL